MNLTAIPALQSNYIWLLQDEQSHCVIVDPGEAGPVIKVLQQNKIIPNAILLTHHHSDHVGGVNELLKTYPELQVYGPEETSKFGVQHIVYEQSEIKIGAMAFTVLDVPGHTAGHVAYLCHPYLFCGDVLFSAGCGRIFEGTPQQMYASIQKLNALPEDTLVCCAHEYTLNNLEFALAFLPEDHVLEAYKQKIIQLTKQKRPTLPSTLQIERVINPFLRCTNISLQKKLGFNQLIIDDWKIFAELRSRKDSF